MKIDVSKMNECSKIALNQLFESIESKLEINNDISIDLDDPSIMLIAIVQRLLKVDINIKHR